MAEDFIKRIGSLIPKKISEKFDEQIQYAGVSSDSKSFIGFLIIFSLIASLIISITIQIYFKINLLIIFLPCILIFFAANYYLLYQSAESKGRLVEKILPDVLQLIGSNIKTGLTIEKALVASARPEFEPLSTELKNASKKILSGRKTEDALLEIADRIKSKDLERAVWLISEGIKSGGQTADLLNQLSNDLRNERELKEEVKANVGIYTMMVWFVSVIGSPVLLGISSVIVKVITQNIGAIPAVQPTAIYGAAKAGKSAVEALTAQPIQPIPPEFVIFISLALLVINAIFSSLVLATIQSGNEKNGFKYIPIMLIISIIVYTVTRTVMGSVFEDMSI